MKNIKGLKKIKLSPWRKVSMGSWRPMGESSLKFAETIPLDNIYKFIKASRDQGNSNANINAFFSLLFGKLFADLPEFNVIVRAGRIYQRNSVDTFFHAVQPSDPKNLTGIKISQSESKSFMQICNEFKAQHENITLNDTDPFHKSKRLFAFLPGFMSRFFLGLVGFINYTLNINLSFLGIPEDSFGSVMISNVGSLGVKEGFTVIAPYTHIPVVISVGAITQRAVVNENNEVEAKDTIYLGFTVDHRIIDGYQGGLFLKSLRKYVADPYLLDGHVKKVTHNLNAELVSKGMS